MRVLDWWEAKWPLRAILVAVITGTSISAILIALLYYPWQEPMPQTRQLFAFVLLISVVASWVMFVLWTWRCLRFARATADNRVVNDYGVNRFGLAMGMWMAVFFAAGALPEITVGEVFSLRFLGWLCFTYLIAHPIGLWAGYFWGRAMAFFFHIPPGEQ